MTIDNKHPLWTAWGWLSMIPGEGRLMNQETKNRVLSNLASMPQAELDLTRVAWETGRFSKDGDRKEMLQMINKEMRFRIFSPEI